LLVVSVLASGVSVTGLIPTKISALGLEFSATDRSALMYLLAVVTIYFLVTFLVYAVADFTSWWLNHYSSAWNEDREVYENARKEILDEAKLTPEPLEKLREHERRMGAIWRGAHIGPYDAIRRVVGPISVSRATIEFFVPVVAGLITTWLLFTRAA